MSDFAAAFQTECRRHSALLPYIFTVGAVGSVI
jgi:hypothetical protein